VQTLRKIHPPLLQGVSCRANIVISWNFRMRAGRPQPDGERAAQEARANRRYPGRAIEVPDGRAAIKAVILLFSDLEGRLHMLDYDKKFFVKSWDNLTFDGSSIRGFTAQRESDCGWGSTGARFTGRQPIYSARARYWYSPR